MVRAVFTTGVPGARVEKTMSFTRAEFENGLRRLTGSALKKTAQGAYDLSDAAGGLALSCTFDPQPDAVLSPLMRLPRALVVLEMEALDDATRIAFIDAFEKTFQRGGG